MQRPPSISEHDVAYALPAVIARNERIVREGFWPKVRRFLGRIPFTEELAAAYFCAVDPRTPARVRAVLLAALAYFVLPADLIPDWLAGIGFTDDASVLSLTIGLVTGHVKERHRVHARAALFLPEPLADTE
jgi:uncharacterized membrane protein YkvA (DUF1232 family)